MMWRMSTLLPDPDRPMMHVTSPSGTSSETLWRTGTPPKFLERSWTSIKAEEGGESGSYSRIAAQR